MSICEIPGCNYKASKIISGEGVFFGICMDWSIHCCPYHSKKEIEHFGEIKASKEVEAIQIVNPFMAVKCELGKTAC